MSFANCQSSLQKEALGHSNLRKSRPEILPRLAPDAMSGRSGAYLLWFWLSPLVDLKRFFDKKNFGREDSTIISIVEFMVEDHGLSTVSRHQIRPESMLRSSLTYRNGLGKTHPPWP